MPLTSIVSLKFMEYETSLDNAEMVKKGQIIRGSIAVHFWLIMCRFYGALISCCYNGKHIKLQHSRFPTISDSKPWSANYNMHNFSLYLTLVYIFKTRKFHIRSFVFYHNIIGKYWSVQRLLFVYCTTLVFKISDCKYFLHKAKLFLSRKFLQVSSGH